MKILFPHREVSLDSSLDIIDRKKVIDALLAEPIEFHAQTMTVEEYLRFTWNKENSKIIMDMIGYYLTKEDRKLEILNHKKEKEMEKGSKRHTTLSSLSEEDKTKIPSYYSDLVPDLNTN